MTLIEEKQEKEKTILFLSFTNRNLLIVKNA